MFVASGIAKIWKNVR